MVTPVVKLENERVNFGGVWHSDTTYLDEPPKGTMLLAREVPPTGGNTSFANMYAAVDALRPDREALLVLGSSLTVMSGFRFVRRAIRMGVPVVVVNRGPTRADDLPIVKLEHGTTEFLADLAGRPS
jgi:NAD-dependent SIR2 family protein deacetylase